MSGERDHLLSTDLDYSLLASSVQISNGASVQFQPTAPNTIFCYDEYPRSSELVGGLGGWAVRNVLGARKIQAYKGSHQGDRSKLDGLESETDGLSTERVMRFAAQFGAGGARLLFLSDENYIAAKRRAGSANLEKVSNECGTYLTLLDVALVRRGELEDLNGPGFSESTATHELLHSADQKSLPWHLSTRPGPKLVPWWRDITRVRRGPVFGYNADGHYDGKHSEYLDEARACWVEGRYVEEELGLPKGFAGGRILHEHGIALPTALMKYGFLAKVEGNVISTVAAGAMGAIIIDGLVDRDPPLRDAFWWAGRSLDAAREVSLRMKSISGDLYPKLRNAKFDFEASLSLYDSISSLAKRQFHT